MTTEAKSETTNQIFYEDTVLNTSLNDTGVINRAPPDSLINFSLFRTIDTNQFFQDDKSETSISTIASWPKVGSSMNNQ
jgi:hypothetical protein